MKAMIMALVLSMGLPVSVVFGDVTVGIAMPTKTTARWVFDGNSMVEQLKKAGYKTDLQYANGDIPTQLSQVENMITKGDQVLVIAAIDGTSLSSVLEDAQAAGVKVIAYDRLIKNSANVDYYATFDNFKVGVLQAQSLLAGLQARFGKGPYNIELFGGSPDDNNAYFFYNGAMSVLQPLIDKGVINIVSGQSGMKKVGTLRWSGSAAQARMENLLSAYYSDKKINAVLSPNDDLAIGVIAALKGVGYGSGNLKMPIVTGQDANIASVKAILFGEQYSTIFKDTRALAGVAVAMVNAIVKGEEPEINDSKTYDNGIKVVPAYLLKPILVNSDNWKETLVDSGYYKNSQIQ